MRLPTRRILSLLFLFAAFLIFTPRVRGVYAASFSFDPASDTVDIGSTFDIRLNISAIGEQVTAADAYVLYDTSALDVVRLSAGTYFPSSRNNMNQAGKVYLNGFTGNPGTPRTGNGLLGTITFRAKAPGTATLTIDCVSGSTTDSNVISNDQNGTDIIQCGANGTSVISVQGTASMVQPTITELPRTGMVESVIGIAMAAIVLIFVGSAISFIT